MDEYYTALDKCAQRYWNMSMVDCNIHDRKQEDLRHFILDFQDGVRDQLPLLKLNRWLGYIQGCLIERGYTTVQAERDWTRPLFKHLDYPVDSGKTGTEIALEFGDKVFKDTGGPTPELLRVIRLALENEERCKNIYNKN